MCGDTDTYRDPESPQAATLAVARSKYTRQQVCTLLVQEKLVKNNFSLRPDLGTMRHLNAAKSNDDAERHYLQPEKFRRVKLTRAIILLIFTRVIEHKQATLGYLEGGRVVTLTALMVCIE